MKSRPGTANAAVVTNQRPATTQSIVPKVENQLVTTNDENRKVARQQQEQRTK
jgi:hypothetical protein